MDRSQKEILQRIIERKENDFFGFEVQTYIPYLDFENAKQFLKDGVTEVDWKQNRDPKQEMIGYMPFAWEKANGGRGISASRTISHYVAWLWLDGNDNLASSIEDYEYYGKDELRSICEYLGLDPDEWDDGIRRN